MPITRRGVLGGALGAGALIAGKDALGASPPTAKKGGKPNIIYIMADDMGYGDLGSFGKVYQTPNIDRLAAEGMKLTQAYANSCVCTATRVGLVTGRYQNRFRVGQEEPLGVNPVGLEPDTPTMPRYMEQLGYRTVLVGKWHMGDAPKYGPTKSGYDRFFGIYSGGKDYFVTPADGRGGVHEADKDSDKLIVKHRYLTDELGDRALKEIRDAKADGVPLFLSLHFTAPHWPWEGPEDGDVAEHLTNILSDEIGNVTIFQKMLTSLDINVGKILQLLADLDMADDSIVIFTSDNGGERFSNVWPLTGMKCELLEGGIRVPVLARWPGHIEPGTVSKQVAISMDWMPTFIEAAGAPDGFKAPTDGMSILPQLTGKAPVAKRTLYWMYKANDQGAMREENWKFLRLGGHEFLFNLDYDEHERANFARKEPDRFARMKKAHADWTASMLPYPKDSSSWDVQGKVPDRY